MESLSFMELDGGVLLFPRSLFNLLPATTALRAKFFAAEMQSDIESSSAIDDIGLTITDECSFRRMQSIEFFRDNDGGSLMDSRTRMRRLTAWRDAMDSFSRASSGYIDRATFLDVLNVQDSKLTDPIVCYGTDDGYVDGKAFLIDAVMELDVTAEEKLRFIFDTLDSDRVGTISVGQVERLLDSNFSNAKLDMANIQDGKMNYTQFRGMFQRYVTGSYGLDKNPAGLLASNSTPSLQLLLSRRRKLVKWYDNNKIRIWWLVIYAIANNVAFWLKWFSYKVDPALGYGLRIARACAQVAMLNVLLLFMPMLRSITQVMKRSRLLWRYIPFDDHIEAHKICGSVCLIAGIIHTLAHVSNEIHSYLIATPDEISRSVFVERKVKAFENGLPPFSTMLQAIPIWTGIVLTVITAISFPLAAFPKLRGGNFNVFW